VTTEATPTRVLVADDQPDVLQALRLLLDDSGYETELVTATGAALDALRARPFDLLLMDLNYTRDTTSGREGLDLIDRVRNLDRSLPIIVMTGWGSIEIAVEAMRRGARSFVQKPWDDGALLEIVRREIDEARAAKRHDARIGREHEEARLIQRGLLPSAFPHLDAYELHGSWQPAGDMGGDCYDALRFSDTSLALSIADVCGKGLPAALLMTNLQAAVRAFAAEDVLPRDLCTNVNRLLCRHMASGRFITFCYCRLDAAQGVVTYATAGHNPPILVRPDGSVQRLTTGGTVLGVFPDSTYEQDQQPLGPGDRLILFTDGISEAENPEGEDFGDDRLLGVATAARGGSATEIHNAILAAVNDFTGGTFQDDATLIVIAVR
jgi:sigma-B regulation protein RsbU (phosphoserine phosphatase)